MCCILSYSGILVFVCFFIYFLNVYSNPESRSQFNWELIYASSGVPNYQECIFIFFTLASNLLFVCIYDKLIHGNLRIGHVKLKLTNLLCALVQTNLTKSQGQLHFSHSSYLTSWSGYKNKIQNCSWYSNFCIQNHL